MLGKVLIANRGEIALRIARTCRELGIPSVAVCSTADLGTAVAELADETVHIGPAPARRSYLSLPALLEAARKTGADSVHPGYGFLSEDPDFADACAAEGLTFIGPEADVIEHLGDKVAARGLMAAVGLPVLDGSGSPCRDLADAQRAARQIGYPLIIKAVTGGGGKGMRVIHNEAEFPLAFQQAQAVARAVFGDGRVYLERYLKRARHVEVQVLRDRHGTGVSLGDRDCSAQRSHQKLIEEAPAPRLRPALRQAIASAALRAAEAAGLTGAGTVEFLVDDSGNFYFMEVNPRLQVEHPVTEMVTGIDLVEQQIRIAADERLGNLLPREPKARGAAIEARINAEDPDRGFAPTAGRLTECKLPGGPFTRVDSHAHAGLLVSPEYDSLIAKVVTWGEDRERALARMDRALDEVRISGDGVRTTRDLLRQVLADEDFRRGSHDTNIISHVTSATVTGTATTRRSG